MNNSCNYYKEVLILTILIRTENERDFDQVHQINYAAFGNREDEAKLAEGQCAAAHTRRVDIPSGLLRLKQPIMKQGRRSVCNTMK